MRVQGHSLENTVFLSSAKHNIPSSLTSKYAGGKKVFQWEKCREATRNRCLMAVVVARGTMNLGSCG